MTDDLVNWLRGWDHCWPSPGLERAVAKAADRIVTLAAERDEAINQLDSAIHSQIVLEKRTAAVMEDRRLILEERDRTFALILARAEAAEAERDRLREALQQFLIEYDEVDLANAEPSSLTEAVLEARAALKGETP